MFLRNQQDHEIQESVSQIEKAIEYSMQYSFDTEVIDRCTIEV